MDIDTIKSLVREHISKNSPEYLPYFYSLRWKVKKLRQKKGYNFVAFIRGNTVFIDKGNLADNPRIVHIFEHELAHHIERELYGFDREEHGERFFNIFEKITGTKEREKYNRGVRIK